MAAPSKLTIRSYDVGFGDCFLLTFHYARFQRHVLVDFGSMEQPEKNVSGAFMTAVATQISADCGGKLAAVIATHRHQDHISGFAMTNDQGPGRIIRDLSPDVVVQPWTEDPRAPKNAVDRPARRHTAVQQQMLDDMHVVSGHVMAAAGRLREKQFAAASAQLRALGMDNIKNEAAVKNLMTMGRKRVYTHFGRSAGLAGVLPGVKVHVLGPPTVKQTSTILEQRRRDPEEFWHLNGRTWHRLARLSKVADVEANAPLFPAHTTRGYKPLAGRWFRHRALRNHVDSLLSIVRTLDKAMNNTSLILLFEINGRKFLFPGDAQYENWMYALGQQRVRDLLSDVDVYKVGHHGSLNATPKTLWNAFSKRGKSTKKDRLHSFLSTREHVHGDEERNSEVPRKTLLAELAGKSTLSNTATFGEDELVRATDFDLT